MSEELFGGQVTAIENNAYAAYLLNSREAFCDIGFRVMRNQENGCLLPCHRLNYNGRIKLVYFTDGMEPLGRKLAEMDADRIRILLSNLLEAIKEIENNGFLDVNCLERCLERIYVENHTSAIKLIYLPVNRPAGSGNTSDFESAMRSGLIQAMRNICLADHPGVQTVVEDLMDKALGLEDIVRKLRESRAGGTQRAAADMPQKKAGDKKAFTGSGALTLRAADGSVTFRIDDGEYVIGKSRERADGVIVGNPAVSRVHCKVFRKEAEFYIVDLGSSNGTFLDDRRVLPSQPLKINRGSRIRIANMEFMTWR